MTATSAASPPSAPGQISSSVTNGAGTPEQILQRLEWRVIRRLDGMLQGDYRTLFRGAGLDFADLREYQPGDDIRHIDWNVTARLDSPHVRQYVEDREITAWFLLDLSASMRFGPLKQQKLSQLVDFVATLARLLTRDGNRVGAILYRQQVERTIPPRSSRNQVLRLIRELTREAEERSASPPQRRFVTSESGEIPSPRRRGGLGQRSRAADDGTLPRPFWRRLFGRDNGSHPSSTQTTTDLATLLHAGLNTFRRRSLVFVLSDFLSEPGWARPLSLLARRHELIAIRLWDARESELPDAGLIVVEDAETGEHLYVDTGDAGFRQRFQDAAQAREATLAEETRRAGVELFAISTDDDVTSAIVRMAELRKRRR